MRGGSPITEIEAEITAFIDHDIKLEKTIRPNGPANLIPLKDTLENRKIKSRKSSLFSLSRLPHIGVLQYLYRKNITNFY